MPNFPKASFGLGTPRPSSPELITRMFNTNCVRQPDYAGPAPDVKLTALNQIVLICIGPTHGPAQGAAGRPQSWCGLYYLRNVTSQSPGEGYDEAGRGLRDP